MHNLLKFISPSLACIAHGIGLCKDIFIWIVRRLWCSYHLLPRAYLLPLIPFVPLDDFTPIFMSCIHAWLYVSVENQGSVCERKHAVFVCLPQSALINIIWLSLQMACLRSLELKNILLWGQWDGSAGKSAYCSGLMAGLRFLGKSESQLQRIVLCSP